MGNTSSRQSRSEIEDVKATLENVCAELSKPAYDEGVDRDTLIRMLNDVYQWMVVNPDMKLRLPAPSMDKDDTFRFIYPEGAVVRNRSKASSRNSRNVPPSCYKLSEKRISSGASVTSTSTARGATKYVGFAEDDIDIPKSPTSPSVKRTTRPRQNSVRFRNSNGLNTTPSMETMMKRAKEYSNIVPEYDDEVVVGDVPEPIILPNRARSTKFADDD